MNVAFQCEFGCFPCAILYQHRVIHLHSWHVLDCWSTFVQKKACGLIDVSIYRLLLITLEDLISNVSLSLLSMLPCICIPTVSDLHDLRTILQDIYKASISNVFFEYFH